MLARRRFLATLGLAPFGLVACDRRPHPVMLQPGELLPSAELLALDGQPFMVFPNSGPFLLNFWATWCPPCRAEMAALDRLYQHFSPHGLKVIGIAVDSDVFLVREYVLKEGTAFPILLDVGGVSAQKRFRVPAYPASYLVDRSGQIAESWLGEKDWDAEAIRQKIGRVL
jgi:thiol-disulfide isomerase/thioredoxin